MSSEQALSAVDTIAALSIRTAATAATTSVASPRPPRDSDGLVTPPHTAQPTYSPNVPFAASGPKTFYTDAKSSLENDIGFMDESIDNVSKQFAKIENKYKSSPQNESREIFVVDHSTPMKTPREPIAMLRDQPKFLSALRKKLVAIPEPIASKPKTDEQAENASKNAGNTKKIVRKRQ